MDERVKGFLKKRAWNGMPWGVPLARDSSAVGKGGMGLEERGIKRPFNRRNCSLLLPGCLNTGTQSHKDIILLTCYSRY